MTAPDLLARAERALHPEGGDDWASMTEEVIVDLVAEIDRLRSELAAKDEPKTIGWAALSGSGRLDGIWPNRVQAEWFIPRAARGRSRVVRVVAEELAALVEADMAPENLRVETRENGRWTQ